MSGRRWQEPGLESVRILPIIALVLWPLLPFPGTPSLLALPWSAACLAHFAIVRPRPQDHLDRALLLLVACTAVQLLPLPRALADLMAPGGRSSAAADAWSAVRPLTSNVGATARALLYTTGTVALFLTVRERLGHGGARRLTRAIVAIGLLAALLEIALELASVFAAMEPTTLSLRTFASRSHLATWLIMALPLCAGYIIAHTRAYTSQPRERRRRRALVELAGSRAGWLIPAAVAISLALVVSLSRSGIMALGVAGMTTIVLVRRRLDVNGRRWLMLGIVGASLASLSLSDAPRVRQRAVRAAGTDLASWAGTPALPRVSSADWPAGSGAAASGLPGHAGSDGRLRLHRTQGHYVRLAREGGLLLLVPLALAGAALVRTAADRLARDTTGVWWLRVGSACGLSAVALQSIGEEGLRSPANAALAAVLAGILVHHRRGAGDEEVTTDTQQFRRPGDIYYLS